MSWYDPFTNPQELWDGQTWDPAKTDLYALWAAASRFAGYRRLVDPSSEPEAAVMLEVAGSASPLEYLQVCNLIDAPKVYRERVVLPAPKRRFVTGRIPVSQLISLDDPVVKRWSLGLPQTARFEPREEVSVRLPPLSTVRVPLVGIIDHGIAFAHRAFREPADDSSSRIVLLWDQDPARHGAPPSEWRRDPNLGYGGCLEQKQIDDGIAHQGADEARIYHRFGYGPAKHRVSHGTHVLDLAVGQPHPLAPAGAAGADWNGYAAHAPIIAVQLPHVPDKDTSGAGLGVYVLDALHFIAARVPMEGGGRPVVINLSDGSYGGRHDGCSMTEEAIDDFLVQHPHIQLVLAAGNAANGRLHAVNPHDISPGCSVAIDWVVLPGDPTDSFCEIWFDDDPPPAGVEVTVSPPGGVPPVTVELGKHRLWRQNSDPHARMAVWSSTSTVKHAGRAGFLLSIGATSWWHQGRPLAPHGRWRIALKHVGNAPMKANSVHVWVERDDPVGNDPGPLRQSRLQPIAGGGLELSRARTLSSLAGSKHAFVVGGYGRGGTWPAIGSDPPSDVPPYVSQEPGRAGAPPHGPDVWAPCEDSPVLHGLLAAGNRSGSRFRMSGTSVAAPLLTRWLVEQLSVPMSSTPPSRPALKQRLSCLHGRLMPGPVLGSLCATPSATPAAPPPSAAATPPAARVP